MAGPHHIYIADDVAYLVDREDCVVLRYTLDGKPLQVIGNRGQASDTGIGPDFDNENDLPPHAAGPFNYPTKMVPAPNGDIYVSDGYQNSRVHRFSADGQLKQSWGQPGKTGPYDLHLPHSVLVTDNGRVYICDRENHRIQVYDAEGSHLASWNNVRRPMDIAVDNNGVFYVAEVYVEQDRLGRLDLLPEGEHRVSVLDENGVLSMSMGRGVGPRHLGGQPRRYISGPAQRSLRPQVRQAGLKTLPYLGKASCSPASTGSIVPVVFDERGPARNSTASATSSAVTLRFNRLRCR